MHHSTSVGHQCAPQSAWLAKELQIVSHGIPRGFMHDVAFHLKQYGACAGSEGVTVP